MLVTNYTTYAVGPLGTNASSVMLDGFKNLKDFDYWISAGTALGFYRDKDFIVGDTDIDIEMLWHKGIDNEIKSAMSNGFDLIRDIYHNGEPQQIAFIKDNVIFDIYIYQLEEDNIVNNSEGGLMKLPYKYFKDLKNIDTKYGSFPAPNPIEDYLKLRYGKDWNIPLHKKGLYGNDF